MTLPGAYKSQPWINAHGHLAGHAAHLRKNVGLRSVDFAAFPHLVLVSLLYRGLSPDGQPASPEEWARLDGTEERIADAMWDRYRAHFALIVTSNGRRDLFFFLAAPASDAETDELIQSIEPNVDYEFSFVHDAEWRPYRDLVKNTE
jgi:hypothetical protein